MRAVGTRISTPSAPRRGLAADEAAARRTATTEWAAALVAVSLGRLQRRLAPGCRLEGCRLDRCAGTWTVDLGCRLPDGRGWPAGPRRLRAVARAVAPPDCAAGDLRLTRRLELALAEAAARLAEESGLGPGMIRGPVGPGRGRVPGI